MPMRFQESVNNTVSGDKAGDLTDDSSFAKAAHEKTGDNPITTTMENRASKGSAPGSAAFFVAQALAPKPPLPHEVWDGRLCSFLFIVFGMAIYYFFPSTAGAASIFKDIATLGCCVVGAITLFASFVCPGDREYSLQEKIGRFILTLFVFGLLALAVWGLRGCKKDEQASSVSAFVPEAPSSASAFPEDLNAFVATDGIASSEETAISDTSQLSEEETADLMVWIPESGTKYHSNSECSSMSGPQQVTLDAAVEQGYEPCSVCSPQSK